LPSSKAQAYRDHERAAFFEHSPGQRQLEAPHLERAAVEDQHHLRWARFHRRWVTWKE
jgi:hypothetical protein